MHTLYTDGSHSVDLKIAGIGGVLFDENNNEVWRFAEPLDENLSQHELKAMELGLQKCLESGVTDLTCYTDNSQNAEQLQKTVQAKEYFSQQDLLEKIWKKSEKFNSISFNYIPRENNKIADHLSRANLVKLTSEKSRVDIVKDIHPNKDFFSCDKIYCTEQFISKTEYLEKKKDISTYYIFDFQYFTTDVFVDVYKAQKGNTITSEKIQHHKVEDNIWKEFVDVITQTLKESDSKNVALGLAKNNDVELMIRGMFPVSKKLTENFAELKKVAQTMDSIFIESNGLVYEAVFPNHVRKHIEDKEAFYLHAMKTLGEDYTLGQDMDIETHFELPNMKKEKIDEIQKKYFGEFMCMMITQDKALKAPRRDFQQVKVELENKGIKFKY